jgi:photosystem II stability/assembly factor-like uncharacterized protein
MFKILKAFFLVILLSILLIPSANAATWQLLTSGTTSTLNDLHFVNSGTGWVVGSRTILKTTDGGTTWTAQTPGVTKSLHSVYFTSANIGWVVGVDGIIIKTTDGGTTWTAQTSGTTRLLNGVYFVNENTGWTIGVLGTILKTTDGGTTWTAQTSGTKKALKGVYFASADIGWIIGAEGTILKTTDGGTTWTAQTSGTTNDLGKAKSIYPGDANTLFVVGDIGTILKTTNGGTTWTTLTSGTTQNLRGVSFVDVNTGWVTGDSGTIIATKNSGTTWTADNSGTSNHLKGVFFVDINNGWAVGDIGTILKYQPPTLSISLSANPSSGTAPLNDVDLTATVSGTATGDIIYKFDCTNDGVYEKTATSTKTTYTATDLCDYALAGTYTAKVEAVREDLTATNTTTISVVVQTLSVSLSADPDSGTAPLTGVDLIAWVSGTASGDITYKFDCTNDGIYEKTAMSTQTTYTATDLCNYNNPATYTAKVVAERQGLTAESTAGIIVIQRTLSVMLSANPNSGVTPLLGVDLTAQVNGNAIGDIVYKFDCENDGTFELTSTTTTETTFIATDLCNYSAAGDYVAGVTAERQRLTATSTTAITVISPEDALAVSLVANPNSGIVPLSGVSLEATVSGTATGDITYKFDCTNDGIFEHESTPTLTNPYAANNLCNYPDPGIYTAKAEVSRKLSAEEGAQTITKSATTGIMVSTPPLVITTESLLPSGAVNQAYTAAITAIGGLGIKTFALITGALPSGLTLSAEGTITGTPTQDGTFYFEILVTDTQPAIAGKKFQIFITPPPTPELPQVNIVSADYVDPLAGGGVKLVNADNTEIAITIESNAVPETITSYSMVINSLNQQSANFVVMPSETGTPIAKLQYDIKVVNDQTLQEIKEFTKPITIKINYLDGDLPAGADESWLQIHFYNETTLLWEALETTVDTINNIATAQVTHLTRFALVAAAAPIIAPPAIGFPAAPAIPPKIGYARVDFNNDRRVNLVDFSILAYWYKRPSPPKHLDLNNDGKIDLVEFSTLIYYWTR